MSAARLKSLGKLVVLIGLPVAFVVGLFGAGVYVGHGHRAAILGFERDWLGLDVEVPGEPARPAAEVTPPPADTVETPQPEPPKPDSPTAETPVAPSPDVKPPASDATPPASDAPPPSADVKPPSTVDGLPIAVADPAPLSAELQARLAEPLKIRVKVVVDEEVFARRSDWIDYAERHVRWASQVLLRQLGVELELRGVVAGPSTWSSGQVALEELAGVGRDGADLVIGIGGRSIRAPVQAGPTSAQQHAATAVAFSTDPTSPAPHLRSLLRAVCHAMGGDPVGVEPGPISFAAEDRRVILERKHLPFAPAAAEPATQPEDDAAPEGED